jgi:hypothetical protein
LACGAIIGSLAFGAVFLIGDESEDRGRPNPELESDGSIVWLEPEDSGQPKPEAEGCRQ